MKYLNHAAKRRRLESQLLTGLSIVLAVAGILSLFGLMGSHAHGAGLCALPFLGIRPMLQKENDDGGGGGGSAITEKEFQAEVLKKLGEAKTTQADLVSKYDNLDKETKKAFEELTKLKNDGTASIDALTLSMKKLNLQLANEMRQANGDPVKRITGDPEKKLLFNAIVRNACGGLGLSPEMKTVLGEDTSPGSSLINNLLANEVYDTLASYGIWNSFAVRRVSTKTTRFPIKTTRATASWILTEGGAITEDAAKAGTSVDVVLQVLASLLPVSRQLLMDSTFDITGDVLNDFAEAAAYMLDYAALQGNGTADASNGGMSGIYYGGTACVAAATHTTMETLALEDWTKCLLTVDPVVLTRGACWWMHPQHVVRALSTKDLNGRPIFLTALEAPTTKGMGSILGYPVVPSFAAPTTNTASSKVCVFGDPQGLVVGIGEDFLFEASDHVGFTTFERYFRGITRACTKIRRAAAFAVLSTAAS